MLIKVTNVIHKWKSDDGKAEIWELTNGLDGTGWATMSKKIADSEGQTMELTTRVSKGGKTYLVQPPKEGYGPGYPSQASPGSPGITDGLVGRLEAAVQALEQSVHDLSRLELAVPLEPMNEPDKVLTDIPKDADDALSHAIQIFGDGATIEE